MVFYYHSTRSNIKQKILKSQKIKFSNFKTTKYVEWLLSKLVEKDELKDVPTSYPGSPSNARFMGEGLYCLESFEEAEQYYSQDGYEVVTLEMKNDFSLYKMDDKKNKLEILRTLHNDLSEFVESMDEESRKVWRVLLELLKQSLYEDYKNRPEMVGVMIHVLREVIPKEKYDVYSKSFYVKMKSQYMTYVLIRNKNAILKKN
ncbi:hypothetical protein [Leuconostoc suionicum]|uniref:hypothetical protein n=1 Tax=Leuconostoc suionicum TaxID=1511761 RepID=UPI00233E9A0B|nr:hypothetical protein [Leuconostoc suionicum]MDC2804848.1 hypothetical protein [Leuconostoc suionicum]MDC2822360.1 hypothetical protein [Leuconostoc suionicum]